MRLALWNANGLSQHRNEVEVFLKNNQLDMVLVSETHFTDRSYFNINGFNIIRCDRPDGTARGGSAIIIKSSIIYEEQPQYSTIGIQATIIKIKIGGRPVIISAIYCRPRDQLKEADYKTLFDNMDGAFIAGGDYNAKHTWWGSRLCTTKGRELLNCIRRNNYTAISTGTPTYWPTRAGTMPDLLDMFVCSRINPGQIRVQPSWDLTSDHSPIIATLNVRVAIKPRFNKIDLGRFKKDTESNVKFQVSLKTKRELDEAADHLTDVIITAKENSQIPLSQCPSHVSLLIRNKISDKRKLRERYHRTLHPQDKREYNKSCKELKKLLQEYNHKKLNDYLTELSPCERGDKNLFNATRDVKKPIARIPPIQDPSGLWLKTNQDKSNAFAEHLEEQFSPFPSNNDDSEIIEYVNAPTQMDLPIRPFNVREVKEEIKRLNNRKASGSDGISPTLVKALPLNAIILITFIFNAIIRLGEYPTNWKKAVVIMIPKHGKPDHLLSSYRPISLLPVLSKVFERLFWTRMLPYVNLPSHQFGFTLGHGTPEQCHRVVHFIQSALQDKEYCASVYLDILQAFDRVWHLGLLYKIKLIMPSTIFLVIQAYLKDRQFKVCCGGEESQWKVIRAGVPQGSVLGPMLYTIYTADMDVLDTVFTGTFADDTVYMSRQKTQMEAISKVQEQLNLFEVWANKWRLKVSAGKSQYVMYTLRAELELPPPCMYGEPIPEVSVARYLGLYIDKKLLFGYHVDIKKTQCNIMMKKYDFLIGRKSCLSIENKVLVYKTIFRPMWSYCAALWGAARNCHLNKLQIAQNKYLRTATNAPWYVSNSTLHRDLGIVPVKDYVNDLIVAHQERVDRHANPLIANLREEEIRRRLRRRVLMDPVS